MRADCQPWSKHTPRWRERPGSVLCVCRRARPACSLSLAVLRGVCRGPGRCGPRLRTCRLQTLGPCLPQEGPGHTGSDVAHRPSWSQGPGPLCKFSSAELEFCSPHVSWHLPAPGIPGRCWPTSLFHTDPPGKDAWKSPLSPRSLGGGGSRSHSQLPTSTVFLCPAPCLADASLCPLQ